MFPPIEYYSESYRLKHGSLWSLSTWLPWQLLQDSMVSADKEEEEAVPRKARLKKKKKKKKKEDEEEKKKRKEKPQTLKSLTLSSSLTWGVC